MAVRDCTATSAPIEAVVDQPTLVQGRLDDFGCNQTSQQIQAVKLRRALEVLHYCIMCCVAHVTFAYEFNDGLEYGRIAMAKGDAGDFSCADIVNHMCHQHPCPSFIEDADVRKGAGFLCLIFDA